MRNALLTAVGPHAYPLFFGLLASASMGAPVHSDLLMVLGAVLAGSGHMDVRVLIFFAPITILCGDTVTFFVGRKYGKQILATRFFQKIFPQTKQNRIHALAKKHGSKFIFMIRFTPGLRAVTFFTAGTMQVEPKDFLKMNSLSTWIYVPSLISAVYFTASQFQQWVDGYQQFAKWVLTAIGLLLVYSFSKWASRRWMENRNAS